MMPGDEKTRVYEVTVVVTLEVEATTEDDARDAAANEMPDGAFGVHVEHVKDCGLAFE